MHVGRGYYVSNLNFVHAYDFSDRGTKVLGQVFTPAFEETTKPIRVEMTLTAFDRDLRVLGHTELDFYSVPASGALLPFEARLFDVPLSAIACVSIAPKGAWVVRD
ncbi:MAG: hypothetical protein AB7Y46_05455 [Armatimonadota bacterium]